MSKLDKLGSLSLLDIGAEKQQLIIDKILNRTWESWKNTMESEKSQKSNPKEINSYVPILERSPKTPEQRAKRYKERMEQRKP